MSISVYIYGLNLSEQNADVINKFEECIDNFKKYWKES